jgi:hypothetical protein
MGVSRLLAESDRIPESANGDQLPELPAMLSLLSSIGEEARRWASFFAWYIGRGLLQRGLSGTGAFRVSAVNP